MATLIQSKQIQGVVTASVIEGEFVVSGSLVTTGSLFVDGDITASGVIRGVFLEGDGSRLTGIVAEGTGINVLSGSIDIVASQFEFSGSGVKINTINTNTASINIPSGYEEGGLGNGDFGLIFGNPGGGKSWSLVALGGFDGTGTDAIYGS